MKQLKCTDFFKKSDKTFIHFQDDKPLTAASCVCLLLHLSAKNEKLYK
jgi:hypothetical protein